VLVEDAMVAYRLLSKNADEFCNLGKHCETGLLVTPFYDFKKSGPRASRAVSSHYVHVAKKTLTSLDQLQQQSSSTHERRGSDG
jgi:hypothetical protein